MRLLLSPQSNTRTALEPRKASINRSESLALFAIHGDKYIPDCGKGGLINSKCDARHKNGKHVGTYEKPSRGREGGRSERRGRGTRGICPCRARLGLKR